MYGSYNGTPPTGAGIEAEAAAGVVAGVALRGGSAVAGVAGAGAPALEGGGVVWAVPGAGAGVPK